jgi:GNAT superfamily N-acetyltransferase
MTYLRDARAEDGECLSRIVEESRAYDGVYKVQIKGVKFSPHYIDSNHVRVAEDDHKKVIAFYSVIVPGTSPHRKGAELDFMFVENRSQGRGLGTALFRDLNTWAAEKQIESITIVSHPPSSEFYEKMGALQTGRLPPSGRVTWWRPIMTFTVAATRD